MDMNISDITESKFLEFVVRIYNDDYTTEEEHIDAILEFNKMIGHPLGSDLIFYPQEGKEGPEAVVAEVKRWRAEHGFPGFKEG